MSTIRVDALRRVDLPEREISLKALKIHPELLQTRAVSDSQEHRAEYQRWVQAYCKMYLNGSPFPAITVFEDNNDDLWVANGFTRVDAAFACKCRSIRGVIHKGGLDEALLKAIEENADKFRSRPFEDDDRMFAAELLIVRFTTQREDGKWVSWADTEIARRSGVTRLTVAKLRLRVRDGGGPPLPDFVQGPDGRLRTYRSRKVGEPTRISVSSRGQSSTHINGQKVTFSRNPEEAARQHAEIVSARESWRYALSGSCRLTVHLGRRSIFSRAIGSPVGGSIVADACVYPVPDDGSTETLLGWIGRAALNRGNPDLPVRVILIGYLRDNNKLSAITGGLAAIGMEAMTPDEFMAEFGPKDADGNPIAPPEGADEPVIENDDAEPAADDPA